MPMHTLDQLNVMSPGGFAAALDGVFEHASWVAEAAASQRPFPTVSALHDALMAVVRTAPADIRIRFLQGHPALSPKALADPGLTASSRTEQSDLGMSSLGEHLGKFEESSAAYEQRFGFPFIVCVRRQTPPFVLRNLERRLGHDLDQELAAALTEIGYIARLRLVERVTGPGMPKTAGHLSTHVLDTARGKPAERVRVELFCEDVMITTSLTNHDGRTEAPLLPDGPLRVGRYELRFHVEDYFAGWPNVPSPPWYDVIPIRFGIAEPEGHYHVPLLLGAWTYTTYRGS
jgi:2-oxo-4-hydroxy-4-carboxy-5-ureidoimidazoline decarboxylase